MRSTDTNLEACGQRTRRPVPKSRPLAACLSGLVVLLAGAAVERPAFAQEFTFHIEPAAAFWLDKPQSTRFTPGFYAAVRPGIQLGRVVALQLSYALLLTPAGKGFSDTGVAHFVMGGIRVRPLATLRPASEQLGGLFVDFNVGYVRTGSLDRLGFDAGLGYGFQVADSFSLGPVVRYGQVVQPDDILNRDPTDAKFLTVGIDFAFGPAHKEESREEGGECATCATCATCPACPARDTCEAKPCLDNDRDGVCNIDDRCPDQIGPPATLGCPIDPCSGKPLIVLVQFDYDSSQMPAQKVGKVQTMDPVLDSVAKAIAQEPDCRVCIIGHASDEGPADYNQELSERRAQAVQGYMTARGLTENRMPAIGLGVRCPIVPEQTRVLNRRVEFRRLADGESCPTDCSR
jgi:hypothetical protein